MLKPVLRLAIIFSALFFTSDTGIFDKKLVLHEFKDSQSYPYLAARYGSIPANIHIYNDTHNLNFLKAAANLGDAPAAIKLYQHYAHKQPQIAVRWLNQAIANGSVEGQLIQIEVAANLSDWDLAQRLIKRFARKQQIDIAQQTNSSNQILSETSVRNSLLSSTHIARLIKANKKVSLANIKGMRAAPNINLIADLRNQIPPKHFLTKATPQQSRCLLSTSVVVYDSAQVQLVKNRLEKIKHSDAFKELICITSVLPLPELNAICDKDSDNRIECNLVHLAGLYRQRLTEQKLNLADKLIAVVDDGEANTRSGLMFLDINDDEDVIAHELAHWLGLYDEYQINRQQQNILCKAPQPKRLGKNLILSESSVSKVRLEKQFKQSLYAANTCRGTSVQAYKFQPHPSFMEFLDIPIDDRYLQYLRNKNKINDIPAAMNFALAHKVSDVDIYSSETLAAFQAHRLFWLKQASDQSFGPAQRMLAQEYIKNREYLAADRLLHDAAEKGDPTSQVLLGHYYIESPWMAQDLKLAARWYKAAAEQGDPYGLYFYGKCLENGWGCPQDIDRAFTYYQKAADIGSALAQKRLAMPN